MAKSKNLEHSFQVRVPHYSILNPKLIDELDHLFDLVPPHMLRRSINDIFWAYICNTEQEDLKPGIKEIATDFNCLLHFLEVAEIYEKEKEARESRKIQRNGI